MIDRLWDAAMNSPRLSMSIRRLSIRLQLLAAVVVVVGAASHPATAATRTWTGDIDGGWGAAGNWAGGAPTATDTALFDSTSINNLATTLTTNTSVLGIRVTSPAGGVSIGTNTLTLGTGGIDMSSATQNLSISSGLTLASGAQAWNVASGRSLAASGAFTRSTGATLNVSGAGTATISGVTANTLLTQASTLAPYATFNGIDFAGVNGSGAVVSGSTVLAYLTPPGSGNITISNTNVPINVANGTGVRLGNSITVNYGLTFNTNRGGNWTIDTAASGRLLTTGGLLVTNNVGPYDVVAGGAGTGFRAFASVASGEFIIHQYNSQGSLILNTGATINNNTNSNLVTKDGVGKVVFNTGMGFTGALRILEGTVQIGNASTSGTLNASATVATSGTLAFNRTDAITFTNAVSGTGVVAQVGSGLATMSNAANSYSGGTVLSSGTVSYANSLADFGSGGFTFNGGAFQWKSGDTSDISARTVTFVGNAPMNPNGGSVTLANPIGNGGAGGLSLIGSGTLNLTAANSFSGTSTISAGVLKANNASGSALGGGPVNVASGGTLSGTGSVSGLVTAASGAVLAPGNGVGTLTLGSLTLSGGSSLVWEFNATPANDLVVVSTSNGLTINGGAVTLYSENTTSPFSTAGTYNLFQYTGSISGSGVAALTVANQQAGKNYTFGESGGFVTLTIASSGLLASWNVDANGTWTNSANWNPSEPNAAGDTATFGSVITAPRTVTLDANRTVGNLVFDNANAYTIAPAAGEALTIGDGTADKTLQVTTGNHTVAAGLVLSATTITADIAAGQSLTLSGPISGTAAITKGVSAGTLYLTGSNSYSGGTNINVGTVEFAAGSLGGSAVTINGGTLRYAAGNTEDISTKTLTVGASGATISTNGNDVTLANSIGNTGSGGLTKAGAGTLTLGGSNSYTGATTITGGTLVVAADSSLGDLAANTAVVLAGGALQTPSSFSTGRSITVTAASTLDAGSATTLSGAIGGTQPITRVGSGLLTLSGTSTGFSGGMVLAAGTTALGGGQANGFNAIGTGPITFQNGAVLNLNGYGQADNATSWGTLSNAITVAAGQSGTLNMPPRATVSGSLTGSGTFTVNVAATRDDFQGNWGAFAGVLNLAGPGDFRIANFQNSVFTNSKLTIGGGVNVYQAFNPPSGAGTETVQAIGELSGSGSLGGNPVAGRFVNWTVGGLSTSSTFAGAIADTTGQGAAKLTKVGTGVLTLTGTSTHTGATTVSTGSLLVDGLISASAVTVGSAGLLGGNGTLAGAVTVSGTLSPGRSPGLITLGSLTLNPSATTLIEVVSAGTRGVDYDAIDVTGPSGLTYGGTMAFAFGGAALPENTALTIFGFTGTPSSTLAAVSSTGFYSGSWTNLGVGTWQITSGTSVATFTEATGVLSVVPEPSTTAVALLATSGLVVLMLRRRHDADA
jgi:autotransporter-associated beta strand protein